MTVFRRWILPIAWLAVFAVIAVALAKIAFFDESARASAGDGIVPTGELDEPLIAAWRDTVRHDLELAATVLNDPAAEVKVTAPGTVVDVFFAVGDAVATGDIIASVREEILNDAGDAYGVWSEIRSPADGTLSSFAVVSGQRVAAGDAVGSVAPSTFRVQGTIAPADRYGLLVEPTEATVAIAGGPAPFTCGGLALETPLPGAGAEGQDAAQPTTTVRCAVPPDVRVFPGLSATMTIAGGLAEDVVVVPVTAVLGAADAGVVYAPGDDGEPEERPVTLGLNDGVNVEILEGIVEGDTVFEYVPGTAVNVDCLLDPGAFGCETAG
ncbi:HlyD family efflux transporter periplasmic adaptor subunit [Microbacterium album]|uniref:Uncharacterized protein n=1 Tax=Microbacterium album TaxID=2053191 RepID=A0A917ICR2_9MICO|nr:HlyD family efflux transporter periplasmic adaptor subunit [Microbacterium album]GGH35649.1 hypothetical protein GCM10010921_04200 [Microbacterium album]